MITRSIPTLKNGINYRPLTMLSLAVGMLLLLFSSTIIAKSSIEPQQKKYLTVQQQLNSYRSQLKKTEALIEDPAVTIETLNRRYQKSQSILSDINKSILYAEEEKKEHQSELLSLGPLPSKDQPKESEESKKQRERIEKRIARFGGMIKQAKLLKQRISQLSLTITEKRLAIKAKKLVTRDKAFFESITWSKAWQEHLLLFKLFNNNIASFGERGQTVFSDLVPAMTFILFIMLALFLAGPLAWYLKRRYSSREDGVSVDDRQRSQAALIDITSNSVLPVIAFGIFFISSWKMQLTTPSQWQAIYPILLTYLSVSMLINLYKAILYPANEAWRCCTVSSNNANKVYNKLSLFTLLFGINALLMHYQAQFIEYTHAIDTLIFLCRVVLCIVGLQLLKENYWRWLRRKHHATFTSSYFKRLLTTFIGLILCLILVSNPFLMLIGYTNLANVVINSCGITLLILLTLFLSLQLLDHIIVKSLGLKPESETWLRKTLQLEKHSAQMIHYWLMALIVVSSYFFSLIAIFVAWGIDTQYITSMLEPIIYGFKVGNTKISLIGFAYAVITFILLFSLTRMGQRVMQEKVFPYTKLDSGSQHAINTGLGYLGVGFSSLMAISVFGVSLQNLTIILGALSVGIGFGMQHVVGNFISGIIMLIERPIKVGDFIVSEENAGVVQRISVRATEIRATNKSYILIPNSQLISLPVINYTMKETSSRVDLSISASYDSDVEKIREILFNIAQRHGKILKKPEPEVLLSDFGESAVLFTLRIFVGGNSGGRARILSDLRYMIAEKFKREGITIPYPQRDIHIKQAPPDTEEE